MFVFAAKVNGVAHFVVVVVVRRPENGLIALLCSALRRLFKSRWRGALCDNHTGNIWGGRHLQCHWCRLARRDTGLALRPHAGLLQRDSINHRRYVAWQIRQTYPINAVAGATVVNDCLPLHEPRWWCFGCAARFRVWAEPARPLTAGIFRVS